MDPSSTTWKLSEQPPPDLLKQGVPDLLIGDHIELKQADPGRGLGNLKEITCDSVSVRPVRAGTFSFTHSGH